MNLSQVILSAFKSGVFHADLHAVQRGVQRQIRYHDMGSVNVVTDRNARSMAGTGEFNRTCIFDD
jgi:hypothetical protein